MGGQGGTQSPNYRSNTASDPYGFAPQDWIDVNRFVSNPLNSDWAKSYQMLIKRIQSTLGNVPGMTGDESSRFYNDLPINIGQRYNILPPMQNWPFLPGVPGQ
jgi:hypothetical protein